MLSTTVEPECRQRPFVFSYAMAGPDSGAALTAQDTPVREASKALVGNTIHPEADHVHAFGDRRAHLPAVR